MFLSWGIFCVESQSSIIFSARESHWWPSFAIHFLANLTGFGSKPAASTALFQVPNLPLAAL